MGLADYTPERAEITRKGKPLISVRGLNLDDLKRLVAAHLDDLRELARLLKGAQEQVFATLAQDGLILKLATEIPALAHEIIAIAADQPDDSSAAARLPLGLQARALDHILRLTFEDIGGPKAFAATILNLIQN